MALDKKVYEAIYTAVNNNGQSEAVAKRMMNLLEESSENRDVLSNLEKIKPNLDTILDAIKASDEPDEDEE